MEEGIREGGREGGRGSTLISPDQLYTSYRLVDLAEAIFDVNGSNDGKHLVMSGGRRR